ncbi:nuclear transport factor 2 family protein [Marmoricola sp. URHB0036]|jgi:hypothetical protein|uniref:nuclear transport factor 2 family protein n=1 Tax=Marmoricola sp. URHB0036 TaxID=1298863 RepID=UPI00041ED60A|nr:nuclear transport factor 2 family protein [Marmoricola sp. URHB0036]
MSTTHTATDVAALARAIEARDAESITARYAADATLTLLDRDHPPSSPQVLTGRDQIGDYYRDICGRNIDHQVRDAVSTATGLAFTQHCRYPDGGRVVCTTVATVHDGLIVSQTGVQVWD